VYDPVVFVHCPLTLQLAVPAAHSSTSTQLPLGFML
jgi:hypothetical protein